MADVLQDGSDVVGFKVTRETQNPYTNFYFQLLLPFKKVFLTGYHVLELYWKSRLLQGQVNVTVYHICAIFHGQNFHRFDGSN